MGILERLAILIIELIPARHGQFVPVKGGQGYRLLRCAYI